MSSRKLVCTGLPGAQMERWIGRFQNEPFCSHLSALARSGLPNTGSLDQAVVAAEEDEEEIFCGVLLE